MWKKLDLCTWKKTLWKGAFCAFDFLPSPSPLPTAWVSDSESYFAFRSRVRTSSNGIRKMYVPQEMAKVSPGSVDLGFEMPKPQLQEGNAERLMNVGRLKVCMCLVSGCREKIFIA